MTSSSLQERKVWIGGGAVLAAVIAAAAWFLLISPQLSSADSLHSQASDQRAQNVQMQQTVDQLKDKSAHLSTYTKQLAAAYSALPADSGMAEYTRQVHSMAGHSGVNVESITVGQIAPAFGPTSASTTTDGSAASSSTTTAPTPSDTATSSSTGGSAATTNGTPATTAGTVYALNVTVTSTGNLKHQESFLESLRSAGPRYGLLTTASFAPATGAKEASVDGSSTMTVQETLFSQPQTTEQLTELRKLLRGDIGS